MPKRFLILDGYPKESRDQFEQVGMRLAWVLYRDMLLQYVPDAAFDVWLSTDAPHEAPTEQDLKSYDGILWPGCNLTVYHTEDPRVISQLDVARRAYRVGVPSFGTCWGIQVGAYIAGGEVSPHPHGREMGIARNVRLTEAGKSHPMFRGKPEVYSHFVSHDDHITRLPKDAVLLASNDWSPVQAAVFRFENGEFWGLQYHPEYDLHEVARLIVARDARLIKQGFFRGSDDLNAYVERLEALAAEPNRKDLRWQLGIDDHILDPLIRQREFINWLEVAVGAL